MMKGGKLLLAALVVALVETGCSKPEEGTTYVPPPSVQPVKKGTLYLGNNCSLAMNFYINGAFYKFIDGGTYSKKDVPPGLYTIKAVQAENVKPGQAPFTSGSSVTVVAEHTCIVALP
jgi:hypothetical protein